MRPITYPSRPVKYLDPIPITITSIREHPAGVEPTLESIPRLNTLDMSEPLSAMISNMQETPLKSWGFVIYRCTYTDNVQWDKYIDFLKAAIQQQLEFAELSTLLWKYLDWTIIEDREALDGASKQHVRERFSKWVDNQRVERGEGWPNIEYLPRFRYCLYIDQKCLDTVDEYETWVNAGAEGALKFVVCAILDKDCSPKGRDRKKYQSIEGCTREYTGWMYHSVNFMPGIYNRLSFEELVDHDYIRPPRLQPDIDILMPFEP